MFTSLAFYGCLTVALTAFVASPGRWRIGVMLLISCVFYLALAPRWFPLLVGETIVSYAIGIALSRAQTDRGRDLLLLGGLVPVIGALVGLKLAGTWHGLLLPLGISYYTFKLISYMIEIYWDETRVAPNFIEFAAFVSFAPQMVSGPIQRSYQFLRQVPHLLQGEFDSEQFELGFFTVLRGLALKLLIGDRLAAFVAIVDASPGSYRRSVVLTTVLCYTVQLYADFAGYTMIAIGIGRLFGIESPPNFNAPFSATNIQEFWRRWHISLSSWVADYVFTPLNLSIRRTGRLGVVVSLMTSMVLIGLWHGITLTFLIYGVIQGVFISGSALTLRGRQKILGGLGKLSPIRAAFGICAVYIMMTISQIFWQAHSVGAALLHFKLLAGIVKNGGLGFSDIRTDVADPVIACMAVAFWHGAGAPGFAWVGRHVGRVVPNWVIGGVLLLLLSSLSLESGSSFVYGQF